MGTELCYPCHMKSIWVCLLLLAGVAFAQEPVNISLTIELRCSDGSWVEATEARPGGVVRYSLEAVNTDVTTLPAGVVVLKGPVPVGTSYVSESATESTSLLTEVEPSGVKWTYLQPLEPGGVFSVSYQVRVGTGASESSCEAVQMSQNGLVQQNDLVQEVFSETDLVQIDCPEGLAEKDTFCGVSEDSFSLFKSKLELLIDYDMAEVLNPVTAWHYDELYSRGFDINGEFMHMVFAEGIVGPQKDKSLVMMSFGQP